jgi:hypothetical protein
VVALAAVLGVEAFLLLKPKPKPERPPEALRAIAAGANKTTTLGDPKGPIKIDFYAPLTLPWHQKTIGLLRAYDKQHPGRIFVRLMWIGNSEADAEMLKRGFTCAVIFINGEHEFTLPNGKQVDLQKKPNNGDASFYNSEDVITILDKMTGAAVK